jgi:hypothetical protein
LAEGVTFETGVFDGIVIKKLTVFPLVMHLDSADSTDDAKTALLGILEWARDQFGLGYKPSMITRWAYVSDVTFQADFPLLQKLNPTLNSISVRISEAIRENLKEDLEYRPAKFWLSHDPDKRKGTIAPFSIEHAAFSQDDENRFYSEAPVPTVDHLDMIAELENALRDKE